MATLGTDGLLLALGHGVPRSRVLLLEVLDLLLKRKRLLLSCLAAFRRKEGIRAPARGTDQLFVERDLLDLHLVDSSRLGGGAKDYIIGQYKCITRVVKAVVTRRGAVVIAGCARCESSSRSSSGKYVDGSSRLDR